MNQNALRFFHGGVTLARRYGLHPAAVEARRIIGGFDSGPAFYRAAEAAYSRAEYQVDPFPLGISPVAVVAIDPASITRVTGRGWKPWRPFDEQIGTVQVGSWDEDAPPGVPEIHRPYPKRFEEHPVFIAFRKHFQNGVPWEETAYYEYRVNLARTGQSPNDLERLADVEQYFRNFDRIYEDIREEGYQSQFELFEDNRSFFPLLRDELLIDIGRNGERLFVENRHRLAIAKLLGLSRIPAVVLCRHEQWLERIESGTADSAVQPYFRADVYSK